MPPEFALRSRVKETASPWMRLAAIPLPRREGCAVGFVFVRFLLFFWLFVAFALRCARLALLVEDRQAKVRRLELRLLGLVAEEEVLCG